MGSANYQNDGDPRTSGPGFRLTEHPHMLGLPLHWKRPRRIFVNSMSDLFHPDVSNQFIGEVWRTMSTAQQHIFQILTKRPRRMARWVNAWYDGHPPLPNVWLGTSIELDKYSFRTTWLRAAPAAVRFISAEPLLGPLPSLDLTGIDWLIVGAESGHGARRMSDEWARDLRGMCERAGTAFFVKQLSGVAPHAVKDIDLFPGDLRVREYPS
jgi:protein gp37